MEITQRNTGFLVQGSHDEVAGFVNTAMQVLQDNSSCQKVLYCRDSYPEIEAGNVTRDDVRTTIQAELREVNVSNGRQTGYSRSGRVINLTNKHPLYLVSFYGTQECQRTIADGVLERMAMIEGIIVES